MKNKNKNKKILLVITLIVGAMVLVNNYNLLAVAGANRERDDCNDRIEDLSDRYDVCLGCKVVDVPFLNCLDTKSNEKGVRGENIIAKFFDDELNEFAYVCYRIGIGDSRNELFLGTSESIALEVLLDCYTSGGEYPECRPERTRCEGKNLLKCDSNKHYVDEGKVIGKCGVACISNSDCETEYRCTENVCVKLNRVLVYRIVDYGCKEIQLLPEHRTELDFDSLEECESNIVPPPNPWLIGGLIIGGLSIFGGIGYFYLKTRGRIK